MFILHLFFLPLLLLHVCIVGISGAVRACAMCQMCPILARSSDFLTFDRFLPFCFVVYSIYTRTCTAVIYLFASATYRDNRKSYPYVSHLDHTNLSPCGVFSTCTWENKFIKGDCACYAPNPITITDDDNDNDKLTTTFTQIHPTVSV